MVVHFLEFQVGSIGQASAHPVRCYLIITFALGGLRPMVENEGMAILV